MPIINNNNKTIPLELGKSPVDIQAERAALEKEELGYADVLGDAFANDNMLNAMFNDENAVGELEILKDISKADLSYDPFEKAKELGVPPEYHDDFLYANNDAEVGRIAKRINSQLESKKRVDEAGFSGFMATATAALVDLPTLLPGSLIATSGAKGISIGRAALGTAAAGALSTGISEAVLSAKQETRTAEESIFNIAGATVLSGVLGGAVSSLTPKAFAKQSEGIESYFQAEKIEVPEGMSEQVAKYGPGLDAVGSQRVSFEDERLYTPGGIKGQVFDKVANATKFLSPAARTQWNGLDSVVMFGRKLVEMGQLQKKNIAGEAAEQAAETDTKLFRKYHSDSLEARTIAWKEYRKALPSGEKRMDSLAWNEAITDVLANGGKADGLNLPRSAVPFLEKSAAAARKHFDILRDAGMSAGLKGLEADKILKDYVHIMYNVPKIARFPREFAQDVKPHIEGLIDERIAELIAKKDASSLEEASRMRDPSLRGRYIDDITDEWIATLKGTDQSTTMERFTPKTRGPLKERTIDIPRVLVKKWAVNDIDVIEAKLNRVLAGEISVQRKFKTVDFQEARSAIDTDYRNKSARLADGSRELIELNKHYKEGLEDLEAMWDMVRGTYRASGDRDPDDVIKRALAFGRTWNFVRLMGGTVVSSTIDPAYVVFRHGFKGMFGTQMKTWMKSLVSPEMQALRKSIKGDIKYIGSATEKYLNSRTAANYGLGDPYAHGTGFERLMDNLGKSASKYIGINFWNDGLKSITSTIAQARIIDNVFKSKLNQEELQYMAGLGLGRAEIQAIAAQVSKHGKKVDNIWSSGIKEWNDPDLVDIFRRAIIKDADNTIVTKGVGDVPIKMNSDVGKTIGQFLSFGMASNQRILLSGLQRMDSKVMQGFVSAVTMGMMVEIFKRWEKDEEIPDMDELIYAGLDRSGVISVPMMINNKLLEPLGIGARDALGLETFNKTPEQNFTNLVGPTGGLIVDGFKVSSGILSAIYSAKDEEFFGGMPNSSIDALVRLVYLQNHTVLKNLVEAGKEGLKETIGKEN